MKPLSEYTRSALELSENDNRETKEINTRCSGENGKIRRPSAGVDKKGTAAGGLVSIGLILGGGVWLFWEKRCGPWEQ